MGSHDEFQNRGYDSYRPGDRLDDQPQQERRRVSESQNNNNNRTAFSFRRDYVDDGRERYPSESTYMRDREKTRSPPPAVAATRKPHRRRNSSFNPAPVGLDTTDSLARLSGSTSAVVTPRSPTRSISIPIHNPGSRVLSAVDHQNSRPRAQTQFPAEPEDIRQKSPSSRAMSEPGEIAPSVTHLGTEDGLEMANQSQSWSIKQLVHFVSARDRKKLEYESHRLKCEALKDELNNAKKSFLHNNPYVLKLQNDLKTTEEATLAKKEEMKKLGMKEKAALDSLESYYKNHDSLAAGVSSMKSGLAEEKVKSRKLEMLNDSLQKQMTEMKDAFKNLSNQINQREPPAVTSKLHGQIQDLEKIIAEDSTNRNNLFTQFEKDKTEIAKIRDEIKQMSVSQAPSNSLAQRVDALEEQRSAGPQPTKEDSGYLKMEDLYPFISQYNDFEVQSEARLEKLEKESLLRTSELSRYATADALNNHVKKAEENSDKLTDVNIKLAVIDGLSQKVNTDLKSILERAVKWDESSVATSQVIQEVANRVKALEMRQQHSAWFTNADGQALQSEARTLQTTVQTNAQSQQQNIIALQANLDRISQAHSHSISSLNQRFNNLHTDQLARQILSVLDPSLATMKPDVDGLKKQVKEIQTTHETTKAQQALFSKSLDGYGAQIGVLKSSIDKVQKLSASHDTRMASFNEQASSITKIDQGQTALIAVVKAIQQNIEKDIIVRNTAMNMMKTEVEASVKNMSSSLRTEIDQTVVRSQGIQRDLTEAETRHQSEQEELLREVTQARDDIERRLAEVTASVETHAAKLEKLELLQQERSNAITSPTIIRKVDLDNSAAELSRAMTARSSQNAAGGSPQTKSSRTAISPGSSLAKHFQSRTEVQDDSDTIDITPAVRSRVSTKASKSGVVEILDSDQDQDRTENGDEDSDQDLSYLSKWTKKTKDATINRAAQSSTPGSLNGAHDSPKTSEKHSASKRKRESSSQTSKGGKGNGGSRSNTPHSSGVVRKKPKT